MSVSIKGLSVPHKAMALNDTKLKKEVKAVPISVESFAPFGTFCNMVNPTGHALQGAIHSFYRNAFMPMTAPWWIWMRKTGSKSYAK